MTGPSVPVKCCISFRELEAMLLNGCEWEVWPVADPSGRESVHADTCRVVHGHQGLCTEGDDAGSCGVTVMTESLHHEGEAFQYNSILGFVERSQLEQLLVMYNCLNDADSAFADEVKITTGSPSYVKDCSRCMQYDQLRMYQLPGRHCVGTEGEEASSIVAHSQKDNRDQLQSKAAHSVVRSNASLHKTGPSNMCLDDLKEIARVFNSAPWH